MAEDMALVARKARVCPSAARGTCPVRRLLAAAGVGLALAGLAPAEAAAAPQAELWERWTAHDPASPATIDHGPFERLLKAYIVRDRGGLNRFAYGRVSDRDRAALAAYIAGLSAVPISRYRRAEQLAYWINLYNALTLQVVLAHYPVASIRDIDISPGLFSDGPWGKKLVEVEGVPLSLDDIEHRILRPIWRDPRIHYAVNCAAVGCPNLQEAAFTASNAEELLEKGAREYVNGPRGARIEDGRLVVSSLYLWYGDDFGGDEAGVIAHLRRYAAPRLEAALGRIGRIAGHGYDWGLNDAAGP